VIRPASSADPECWLSGAGLAGPGLLELADKAEARAEQERQGRDRAKARADADRRAAQARAGQAEAGRDNERARADDLRDRLIAMSPTHIAEA
jgi:hypothetical protein